MLKEWWGVFYFYLPKDLKKCLRMEEGPAGGNSKIFKLLQKC